MPLIRDDRIVDDPWRKAASADELAGDGPLLVALELWREHRDDLLRRNSPLGVTLAGGEPPSEIADDLDRLDLVALEFKTFRDGRGYSYARQLRDGYGYRGELRAVGHVLRDQAQFLRRCGIDSFEVADDLSADTWARAAHEISFAYQPASDAVSPLHRRRALARRAAELADEYADHSAEALLRAMIVEEFPGRIGVVTSFGAESAVLLDMVARIDPATPVIFLETQKHFAETLEYRDTLINHLGLTDVRSVTPVSAEIAAEDPDGDLWRRNPDRCCHLRKVLPLERALTGLDAWVTGRKRYQTGERATLPLVETIDGRVKINPLAAWSAGDVQAEFDARDLPEHPLADMGYLSIGCAPCTDPVAAGGDLRAGRWSGREKTECGIHNAKWARA